MQYKLKLTQKHYEDIYSHIQEREKSKAIIICGQAKRKQSHCFLAHSVMLLKDDINYEQVLTKIRQDNEIIASIVIFNIDIDSFSFQNNIPIIAAEFTAEGDISAVMHKDTNEIPIDMVNIIGDDIRICYKGTSLYEVPEFADRHAQCFGAGTTNLIQGLSVGVVGISGTGCFVVELLARLGIGQLVLIDYDKIEECNLNRIINSKRSDIGTFKTKVAARTISEMELGTKVITVSKNLASREAVEAISNCDVVFGCVDSSEGRYLLNLIASFYIIPYIDVGIRLDADGKGGIDQICGSVHYIKPAGNSIVSRGAVTMEDVAAEGMKRTNPKQYKQQVKEKYVKGVSLTSPAVVSLNAFYASWSVNEFLARIHPLRNDDNSEHGGIMFSLTQEHLYRLPRKGTSAPCPMLFRNVGKGDVEPLLNRSELS